MPSLIERAVEFVPGLGALVNRYLIHKAASATVPRPHRYSLWSPHHKVHKPDPLPGTNYVSWPSLVDRGFTARHLGRRMPAPATPLPPLQDVVDLFRRGGATAPNPRSSALFCFFAQWFTDSFLRTHSTDPRLNTSNHEIDLCQIYGLDERSTWALRQRTDGLLKTQLDAAGHELPPYLYSGGSLDPQFMDMTYLRDGAARHWEEAMERSQPGTISDPRRRDRLYAAGLDRGNSTIVYSAFNIIFLREHNRIARRLKTRYPGWDDDQLFETARMINIRQVLTVVVNDYIRHIAGSFPFSLDRSFGERKSWYRTNRISIEFNLLYRWHSLVPDELRIGAIVLPASEYRFNNAALETHGLEKVISAASAQPAGRIGLFNTPAFLIEAEERGLKWGRDFGLRPFNDYRERFGEKRYKSIREMADGDEVAAALDRVYGGDPDAVEFTVGLFAERRGRRDVMGETMRTMVAYDAFTHILTNPLLCREVHCPEALSELGVEIIEEKATLAEIVARNADPSQPLKVSLAHEA